jgi:hypothetical protein
MGDEDTLVVEHGGAEKERADVDAKPLHGCRAIAQLLAGARRE